MRAVVHIVKRDGPPVRRVGYLANKAVLLGDWLGNDVALNAERLMEAHHGGRGRKTRHVLVSLEQGGDLPDEQMGEVAARFAAAFAPGVAWLGAVDRNTKAVHIHLLLVNSDGERCLNFSPSILQQMQNVAAWSGGLLENGRRGAILQKLTTAKQLSQMTYEQIQNAIETGTLTIGRRSKFGVVSSVVLAGRRVRLSTVQRAAALAAAHGDATHRLVGDAKMGVVGTMDAQRQRRKNEARRRDCRDPGKRPLGAANAHPRQAGTSHPEERGKSSGILPSHAVPVQRQTPPPRTFPVAYNPKMGGRTL